MAHLPHDGRRRWHLLLLLIPFLWQIGAVPWANGVALKIASLPFLMVWQMGGIVVTTLVLWVLYRKDKRRAPELDA
jgi:hypothetical protein